MSIQGVSSPAAADPAANSGATSGASATGAAQSASGLGPQEFMSLLVAQLKNQDPLNPMDNTQFVAQMAQLSTLQSTNSVASGVQGVASGQQTMQAVQMVGRQVTYTAADGSAAHGVVQSVSLTNPPMLTINNQPVALSALQSVR